MSNDCREIVGTYVDPNVTTWDREEHSANGMIYRFGGHAQMAWIVLKIPSSNLKVTETKVHPRSFSLSFAGDQVVIDYSLDHEIVETVHVSREYWSCNEEGLILRLGQNRLVVDKLPSQGSMNYHVTLYRRGGELYARASDRISGVMLYLIPLVDVEDKWYRFPVVDPTAK